MRSSTESDPLPILVVDDDSALIRTLADILRMHGFAPETAGTASEGLAMAENRVPALAVVDLRLPDMDGMELAARLHELSERTEVVVLTGNASVESAVAALRSHSVDYLIKPVKVDQLLQVASLAAERWQRREAEDRLRESDERFRRVVESNMVGFTFWRSDGTIEDANDAFLRMVGYDREDLADGRLTWMKLTPSEYDQIDQEKLSLVVRDGVIPPYEKEYVRKDGTRVPILIGAATLDARGERGVSYLLDISDRKAAERALEARAAQQSAVALFGQRALASVELQSILDDATQMIARTLKLPLVSVLELRSDGRLQTRAVCGWNPPKDAVHAPAGTQWGFTLAHSEPAIVEDSSDLRFVSIPEAGLGASGASVVIPGSVGAFGVLAAHDIKPRAYSLDDVHFLQAMAHVIGLTAERHRGESIIRQSQRLEAVGRLASSVAHDFNNMLSAITGFAELVRAALPENDPLRGDVSEIRKAADRAATLTRQLLTFSKQQAIQPRILSINTSVTDMQNMIRRLLGDDIELVVSLAPDAGQVHADPGQIEQVLLNLCINARDAMPDGGSITIETCNVRLDPSQTWEGPIGATGDYVQLTVTDTGIGMDAETRARIFEPFFSTKGPEKGTGLGLATVYGVVKQSGGEVWVDSEDGVGTSFKIFLPRLADETMQRRSQAKC